MIEIPVSATRDRLQRLVLGLDGEAAAMAAGDAALIAMTDRRLGHRGKCPGVRVSCLVDMQVEVQIVFARQLEELVEQALRSRRAAFREARAWLA